MDWQPIETAPKDGSIVDLWVTEPSLPGGYRATDAWWDGRFDIWRTMHGEPVDRATHWRELPEPPTATT